MQLHKKSGNFFLHTTSSDISSKESNCTKETKEPLWKCRYVIALILALIYFYFNYIRLHMSVSIVAMVNNSAVIPQVTEESESCPRLVNFTGEGTPIKMEGEFNWSSKMQGFILGSFYFGHMATLFPSGFFTERFGSKWFLFASSLLTGICTLLMPLFAYLSSSALIVLQVLRGLLQGLIQPAIAVLIANWAPKNERGFLFTLIYSGGCPGTYLGSLITGYVCESAGGWPASFYLTGAVGIVLSLSVLFFVAENPKVHSRISKAEYDFILSTQENSLSRKRPKLPWCKMLKSLPLYALAFAYFGHTWASCQFYIVHPIFLGTILHYPIGQNGLFSGAPFLLQFLGSQASAWISLYLEKNKKVNVDFLRKFWTVVASVGASVCLLGIYLAGCDRNLSVILGILSVGCIGLGFSGCWVVSTDMTPTFAGTVHGICCTIGYLASCLVPIVTGYLTDEMQTIEQWNKVFFLSIGIFLSSGIVFAVFGSAEVQPWNFIDKETSEKDNKQSKDIKNITEKDKEEEQTRF